MRASAIRPDGGSPIDTAAAHGQQAAANRATSVSQVVLSPSVAAERLRVAACDAAAPLLLSGGVDAVSISAVYGATSITKARLYRMFPNREGLITEVYRQGHACVQALCDRGGGYGQRRGLEAVIALSYDLIEQAETDPVVRAAYAMEVSQFAPESGLPSLYEVWTAGLTELIAPAAQLIGDGALTDSSDHDSAEGMARKTGRSSSFWSVPWPDCVYHHQAILSLSVRGLLGTATRLYVVLRSILPAMCADAGEVRFIDAYLGRVHTRIVDADQ